MSRTISSVEASDTFWDDLEPLRKEPWYNALRRTIAEFVHDRAAGNPVRERGFSNPRMKGIMHLNLPRDMRLFHLYPDSKTLRLCMVADHKLYGFNGKHTGKEGKTADKIRRAADMPVAVSPFWSTLRWRRPHDLCETPELGEMSPAGLHGIISEIDEESCSMERLLRHARVRDIDEVSPTLFEDWADRLLDAQDRVYETIEQQARARRPVLEIADFEPWMCP